MMRASTFSLPGTEFRQRTWRFVLGNKGPAVPARSPEARACRRSVRTST